MTREEMIRVLDPETRNIEKAKCGFDPFKCQERFDVACRMAVAALRAQKEPNTPLTLEELREMGGEEEE